MATKTSCDLCKVEIPYNPIKVRVEDGEHPHNGDQIYKRIDVCPVCILKLDLHCNEELESLERKVKKK